MVLEKTMLTMNWPSLAKSELTWNPALSTLRRFVTPAQGWLHDFRPEKYGTQAYQQPMMVYLSTLMVQRRSKEPAPVSTRRTSKWQQRLPGRIFAIEKADSLLLNSMAPAGIDFKRNRVQNTKIGNCTEISCRIFITGSFQSHSLLGSRAYKYNRNCWLDGQVWIWDACKSRRQPTYRKYHR